MPQFLKGINYYQHQLPELAKQKKLVHEKMEKQLQELQTLLTQIMDIPSLTREKDTHYV